MDEMTEKQEEATRIIEAIGTIKIKMNKREIEKAAKKWEIDHSNAPNKETPDWIECDFKAGANFVNEKQPYTAEDMYLNMQYYMEYCQMKGYVTPMEWLEKHKHFGMEATE